MSTRIPLFPLQLVMFPGSVLPLRIFETRYLDMVSQCCARGEGFGICLLIPNDNDGQALATIGTLASIIDFSNGDDGLLGIIAKGEQRFKVAQTGVQHDGLIMAEVEWLPSQQNCPIPPDCSALVDVLQEIHRQLEKHTQRPAHSATDYDDAEALGFRLAELLPISLNDRQLLLEMDDPVARLRRLLQSISESSE